MRTVWAVVLFALAVPLHAAAAAPAAAFGNAPYDAPPEKAGRVSITFDFSAADQILGTVSAEKLNPTDASTLQTLPAVRRQITESGKDTGVFAGDLAGAFLPESRPATFDFRSVRLDRDRWKIALAGLVADREKLAQTASRRAEAPLPADGRSNSPPRWRSRSRSPGSRITFCSPTAIAASSF
jgi:hypothetical protein